MVKRPIATPGRSEKGVRGDMASVPVHLQGLGEGFGALIQEDLAESLGQGTLGRGRDVESERVGRCGAHSGHGWSVDHDLAEKAKHTLSAVAAARKAKELRR